MVFSNEKRPLKRSRLGPPDVYPQDPKQKEDELTLNNVKMGFQTTPQLTDEFGTARNCNITPSKIGSYFNAILSKKEELNTLPDSGRKKQQINTKDNFWPATARTKNAIENWFKDLAGTKSLISLSKKAPNFNKKEEIFILLCEYNVPLMRAAWFVKLSSAYTVAVSEAKMKKRQLPDPTQEWTSTLIKFLKDQLLKLQEFYHQSLGPISTATEDQKLALKQWQYCTQLAKYLYEECLLERLEFLHWILEVLDKLKSSNPEDGMLRIVLPLCLQYLDEFVQSELLSRKLAYLCCKKLGQLALRGNTKEDGLNNALMQSASGVISCIPSNNFTGGNSGNSGHTMNIIPGCNGLNNNLNHYNNINSNTGNEEEMSNAPHNSNNNQAVATNNFSNNPNCNSSSSISSSSSSSSSTSSSCSNNNNANNNNDEDDEDDEDDDDDDDDDDIDNDNESIQINHNVNVNISNNNENRENDNDSHAVGNNNVGRDGDAEDHNNNNHNNNNNDNNNNNNNNNMNNNNNNNSNNDDHHNNDIADDDDDDDNNHGNAANANNDNCISINNDGMSNNDEINMNNNLNNENDNPMNENIANNGGHDNEIDSMLDCGNHTNIGNNCNGGNNNCSGNDDMNEGNVSTVNSDIHRNGECNENGQIDNRDNGNDNHEDGNAMNVNNDGHVNDNFDNHLHGDGNNENVTGSNTDCENINGGNNFSIMTNSNIANANYNMNNSGLGLANSNTNNNHIIHGSNMNNDNTSGNNNSSNNAGGNVSNGLTTVGNNCNNSLEKNSEIQISVHFNELLQRSHHRDVILYLSTILQVITLECPTALVWNCVGEGKSTHPLNNSPLDHLTCPPSALPMPVRANNSCLRQQIKQAEESIKARSRAAEVRWSCDKWQQSSDGQTTAKVMNALDSLDRHSFDKTDSNNNLDTLYSKIFTSNTVKDGSQTEIRAENIVSQDEPIIEILCEWAVSCVRYGEHRAMAVAMLLEKRQAYLTGEGGDADDKDSIASGNALQNSLPVFQGLLMKFLDNDAPVLEENGSPQNKAMFTNLVHLFGELIRHDVFSHDAYMCTLISRGDLLTSSQSTGGNYSNKPDTPGEGRNSQSLNDEEGSLFPGIDLKPPKMEGHDYDDSKIDDDLDKLLQHIKEEQQNSMDAPDSPKDVGISQGVFGTQPSRHLLYTTHFPLPQDESSSHDCNQRHVLLYGVGKVRDEARHTLKKMSKEICKLFNKKFSIDIVDGGKVKKYSRNEFNFEAVTNKFQSLSFFDRHVVTWQCSLIVVEMLSSFATGTSNYLPVQEHVAYLFDLMELAYNIYGLIHVCIQILKELPEVENQLTIKGYSTDHSYTTGLTLYIVAVLRRYHSCLLLSREQTVIVFQGLCNIVKHVTNPADCSSAERCILVHLYDLYSSCSLLKCKPHCVEAFQNAYPKIKQALYCTIQPSPSSHVYNSNFMADLFTNPRKNGKIEPQWGRQLAESASNRYSLVCNAIIAVVNETDNDRLNDIALTCAELTACCNSLSAEWLGVLQALFSSAHEACYFIDVLQQVDVRDFSIHNSLAVFVSILIARHCFSLVDFIQIAIPPLVRGGKDVEDEAGARLTCHLLLRLFKTVDCPQPALYSGGTSPHPLEGFCMKLSCDRHLLTATHNTIHVGAVLAVLKAILVVADLTSKNSKPTKKEPSNKIPTPLGGSELSISHILGTSDILGGGHDLLGLGGSGTANANENAPSLSDFAQHVLKQICSQEWVLERCLQNPEELCQPDMLLDNELTPRQAQRLLHMICYPNSSMENNLDQKTIITRILENLDLWTLRISWLDLQLMYKQFPMGSSELNHWLETVAKAAIDVFQLNSNEKTLIKEEKSQIVKKNKNGNIWLVAPLVSKLPSIVQGRVLRVAGQVLESGNWSGKTRDRDRSAQRSKSLLSHQPFLSLVLTCLKGQDDQREGLLTSLHNQLSQYIQLSKDERLSNYEDGKGRALMQDSLQLRFSLVGGMFDTVQRSSSTTTEWAILLLQLITYGVIDLNNNPDLFTTVIDMLATLIHSTLISDSQSDRSDENKKHYVNLMKKLKKEIGDRTSPSMLQVRQLLPLSKKQLEVVTVQPVGCLTDTKGNKIAGFDSIDKKQGLQVYEKQKVSPWEILEGHKNPAPLSWSWFGAIRIERKPLWYQDSHRLLKFHTHNQTKPASYYLDPPPLPPEDLEPVPEKPCSCVYCNQMKDDKADTPSSDTSPRGKKGVRKGVKRKNKNDPVTPQPTMQPTMQSTMQIPQTVTYPSQNPIFGAQQGQPMPQQQNVGQQQWAYGQQPGQQMIPQQNMPDAQQQNYYSQQIAQQVTGPRFERPLNQQSKQAITNMLRMRLPTQQYMAQQPFPQGAQPPMQQRQQFIRRGLEGVQPLRPQQVGMQTGATIFPQGNMYSNMQQGMAQNYGGYGTQQMNTQQIMNQQGGMGNTNFPQHLGFQQGGGGPGGGGAMMNTGPIQRTPDYMQGGGPCINQQRGMGPQRPYLQQAPNVTMNTMSGGMPGPAPPYPRPPTSGSQMNAQQTQQFQVNQQRMRQQLIAMQQAQGNNPNNQALGNPSQPPTPALMAQLQRQTQIPVQNPYSHQPPPY